MHSQFLSLDGRDDEVAQNSFKGGIIFERLVKLLIFFSSGEPMNSLRH